MIQRAPSPTLFPYTTLFRSHLRIPAAFIPLDQIEVGQDRAVVRQTVFPEHCRDELVAFIIVPSSLAHETVVRSEEHTSELQSQSNLVCRLLLEKKKTI